MTTINAGQAGNERARTCSALRAVTNTHGGLRPPTNNGGERMSINSTCRTMRMVEAALDKLSIRYRTYAHRGPGSRLIYGCIDIISAPPTAQQRYALKGLGFTYGADREDYGYRRWTLRVDPEREL